MYNISTLRQPSQIIGLGEEIGKDDKTNMFLLCLSFGLINGKDREEEKGKVILKNSTSVSKKKNSNPVKDA